MSVKKKALSAALWSVTGNGFSQIFNFVVFILLAKLLEVEEFGLVSFSLIIIEFGSVFLSVGINQNLIQRHDWDDSFASTAFWLMLGVSFFSTCFLIFIVAPIIHFYYSALGATLVAVLSVIPFLNGLKLTQTAQLQREFENKRLTIIESLSIVVGGILSIILATAEYGAWALVIGRVVQSLTSTIAIWTISDFKPCFIFRIKYIKEIKEFGIPLLNISLLTFFAGKSVNLIIGTVLGPIAFALFNVAMRPFLAIQALTMQQLNKISLAALSRVETDKTAHTYYRVVALTAFVVLPIYMGFGAISDSFVEGLLGSKWQDSIQLMYLLPFSAPAFVFYWYLPTILISRGFTKSALRINVIVCVTNLVFSSIAVYWGINATIFAFILAAYVTVPIRFRIVNSHISLSLWKTLLAVFPFVAASIFMFFCVLWADRTDIFLAEIRWLELLPLVIVGGISYIAPLGLFFRKSFLDVVNELIGIKDPARKVTNNE